MPHPRLALVTRKLIEAAALEPFDSPTRGWVVEVDGRLLPVKDVVCRAANLVDANLPVIGPADFQTAAAIRVLRSAGLDPSKA